MSDTAANKRCAFLELPAEMRNRIYRESLVSVSSVIISTAPQRTRQKHRHSGYLTKAVFKLFKEHRETPPLLQTCGQIRSEATSIYYGENHFEMQGKIATDGFLFMLGPQRRSLLRSLQAIFWRCTNTTYALWEIGDMERSFKQQGLEVPKNVVKVLVKLRLSNGQEDTALMSEDEIRDAMRLAAVEDGQAGKGD